MPSFSYRALQKSDYPAVRELLDAAFGLHDYVENPKMLEKLKKIDLCSCLAEQKFNRVLLQDGAPVGIAMGASRHARRHFSNFANAAALLFHTLSLRLLQRGGGDGYQPVRDSYGDLLAGRETEFDGVLTLLLVREDCRKLGLGRALLAQMEDYFLRSGCRRVYLYTDESCNYAFYPQMGYTRSGEKTITVTRAGAVRRMALYLYEKEFPRP